jgi:hypothetical protein
MNQFEEGRHGSAQATADSGVDQAKEQVHEVAQRAQEAAGNAQVKVRDQIDQRSTQVGQQVAASALALRAGADELVKQGNQSAADAAQRTAVQAERFGSYLQEADANRILADVEDVARRSPLAVVVAGVIVGAAAARFLKASSSRRYEATRVRPTYGDAT